MSPISKNGWPRSIKAAREERPFNPPFKWDEKELEDMERAEKRRRQEEDDEPPEA